MRQGIVFLNGRRTGILTESDARDYTFEYDEEFLKKQDCEPISLTLPLQSEPYRSEYLFPVFANMLSEGDNRQIQSQLLHIDKDDDFGILLATCQHETIGAITIKPLAS